MKLFLDGHDLGYEMQALCYAFFPGEAVAVETAGAETDAGGNNEDFAYTRIRRRADGSVSALVCLRRGGAFARAGERFDADSGAGHPFDRACEWALGRTLYRAVSRLCGVTPPWGVLTGIRPVKLVRDRLSAGMDEDEIVGDFGRSYYVTEQKARLCVTCAREEERIVALSRPDSASLYISIPFCPSRCLYCSFISHDVAKTARLLPDYVRLLCEEIAQTGALADELSLRLETVYIGGGTPTVLSADQLAAVMDAVKCAFKLDALREYTVEAGRPDTITKEKLAVIMAGGARRISINPQTLDDAILKRIGRGHTAEQVYSAFALAREAGIPSINMDLIAGLPGDTPEGFARTIDGVLALGPESVTVHTLAMKRSSRLVTEEGGLYDAEGADCGAMHRYAQTCLDAAGYRPYYLYRQKNCLGGLENVGYAKPGFEGLYNIFIMDETHSILAAGAGGVTKLRQPCGDRIERVFNFKYPYEYIARFSEIRDRKKKVREFYGRYRNDNRQI